MELLQKIDIKATESGHKASNNPSHSRGMDRADSGENKPFKEQLDKQVDQVKSKSDKQKPDNNQEDEITGVNKNQISRDNSGAVEEASTQASGIHENSSEESIEEDALNTQQSGVLSPFIAAILPESGSSLPLSRGDSNITGAEKVAVAQVISTPLTSDQLASGQSLQPGLISVQSTDVAKQAVVGVDKNLQHINDLINKSAVLTTNSNAKLLDSEVASGKLINVSANLNGNLTTSLSGKANILDARYEKIMSELPTTDVITKSSKLLQVPLTTGISANNPTAQNISAGLITDLTGAVNNTSVSASTLSSSIATNIQNPAWSQQMTQQIAYMIKGGFQQAEIKLNPANLGPMEIKLTMKDDNASVSFVAQHAPVRDALDAAMPRLKEMLEQQGLNLSDANVSTQSEQQQANAQSEQEGHTGSQSETLNGNAETDDTEQTLIVDMDANSGVSIFA